MALKYPLVLKIGIPVVLLAVILLHLIKRKMKYRGGVRVANTEFARKLPEYRRFHIFYLVMRFVMEFCVVAAIIVSLVMIARPVKSETVSNGTKKRDIFLCLDVSYSICYLNYDLVENLQDVVKSLDGDRFGISIYNTSTVLYVPMTDDYDFILSKLEDLKTYFKLQSEYMDIYSKSSLTDEDWERYYELSDQLDYYDAGTLIKNYEKGSSLIGEGLAACLYSFPHIEDEDRTRIIIMSTDNAQEALKKPLIELDEASDFCKKNKVTVFGIFPNEEVFHLTNSTDYESNLNEMKSCVEKTGGTFYKQSESLSVKEIVKSIQAQKAMEVDEITITKLVDKPEVPMYILFGIIILFIVSGAVVLL